MIVIVDYGRGNLRSVHKGFEHAGARDVVVSSDPKLVASADGLVVPGVGAFQDAMNHFQESGLIEPLRKRIEDGVPTLGICLGMQLMFDSSTELGHHRGLGLLGGEVRAIEPGKGIKIPHMGWNTVRFAKHTPSVFSRSHSGEDHHSGGSLFNGIDDETAFYFVHGYHCVPTDGAIITGTVNYGEELVCAVQHENLYAVQFHPEKSSAKGLHLLSNFARIVEHAEGHIRY